jgi:hypothetical protein
MRLLRGLEPLSLLLFLALVGPMVLRAQVDLTSITGTVTDAQGNRIPQCAVRATESATGFQRETWTTSQGGFEPGLPLACTRPVYQGWFLALYPAGAWTSWWDKRGL